MKDLAALIIVVAAACSPMWYTSNNVNRGEVVKTTLGAAQTAAILGAYRIYQKAREESPPE